MTIGTIPQTVLSPDLFDTLFSVNYFGRFTDAAFCLDYAAGPDDVAGGAQTVTVRAGNQVLQSFEADAGGRRIRRIPLPANVLGTGDTTEIQIAVDRNFVPAAHPAGGGGERDLGIQVDHAFAVLR